MRRLARDLFTLCSVLSLLLSVTTCVLWLQTYRQGVTRGFQWRGASWAAEAQAGQLRVHNSAQRAREAREWGDRAVEWTELRRLGGIWLALPSRWTAADAPDALWSAPRTAWEVRQWEERVERWLQGQPGFQAKRLPALDVQNGPVASDGLDASETPDAEVARIKGLAAELDRLPPKRPPFMPLVNYLVPLRALMAATAVGPLAWFAYVARETRRRRKWRESKLCLSCGYDLRASAERCPECGAAATSTGRGHHSRFPSVGERLFAPRVWVSVAVFVLTIVAVGVWGERAERQARQQYQLKLQEEQWARQLPVRKMRTIELLELEAETDLAQAERLHERANRLRDELGLPRRQYDAEAKRLAEALRPRYVTPVPQISRLLELSPWYTPPTDAADPE